MFDGTNDSAGGSSWSQTDGWLSSGDLDEWLGVSVKTAKRVRFLLLNGNNLTGEASLYMGDTRFEMNIMSVSKYF